MLFPAIIISKKSALPGALLLFIAAAAQIFLIFENLIWVSPFLWAFVFWETRHKPPAAFRFLKDGTFFYADKKTHNGGNGGNVENADFVWIEAELSALYFWHPLLISVQIQNAQTAKKRAFCLYFSQFSKNDFRQLRLFFKFLAMQQKISDFPR